MSVEQESVFPKFTEKFLDEHVDMEYICQSDYSWKEAPASAVLLAVEILQLLYSTGLYHNLRWDYGQGDHLQVRQLAEQKACP